MTTADAITEKQQRAHKAWQTQIEKNVDNPWFGWQMLLKGAQLEGQGVPVDPNTPFQGYYRSKLQDKTFEPVHFFKNDRGLWAVLRPWRPKTAQLLVQEVGEGKLVKRKDGSECTEFQFVLDSWIYISRYPVNHAFYKTAVETHAWPDQDKLTTSEALAETKPNAAAEAERKAADKPAEKKAEVPPEQVIRTRLDNAKTGMKDYAKIESDEQQSKALSLTNLIAEIGRDAKKHRDELSRPHNDALTNIRKVWSPLVNDAVASVETLEGCMNVFATFKIREAARLAQEELDRLEAIQKADAEKRKIEDATQTPLIFDDQPRSPPPPPPTPAPAASTQPETGRINTSYGRSANTKAEWVATEITDLKALFAWMTDPAPHAELKAKLLELAQRAKNAGHNPPGVKFEQEAKVKR